MAIQFPCPGCAQPIEVDDTWANQQVGCPYCQRVVTAPETSTLPLSSAVPTSGRKPDAGGTPSSASPAPSFPPPDMPLTEMSVSQPVRRGRPLGIYAMPVALAAVAAMFLWFMMFSAWMVQHIDEEILTSQDTPRLIRAFEDALKNQGKELERFGVLPVLGCLGGLLATCLGVAGLIRNDSHKAWPIAAIIFGVLVLPCGCMGTMVPFATGTQTIQTTQPTTNVTSIGCGDPLHATRRTPQQNAERSSRVTGEGDTWACENPGGDNPSLPAGA